MTMPSQYYEETLYPFQNGVLEVISRCETRFYLTGGTALSRGYYQHRYSDDLDLFVNNDADYKEQVEAVLSALCNAGFVQDRNSDFRKYDNFTSIVIVNEKLMTSLKIDSFNWKEIILEASEKEGGLEIPILVQYLRGMPSQRFNDINWIRRPDPEQFRKDIEVIAREILLGADNSLTCN